MCWTVSGGQESVLMGSDFESVDWFLYWTHIWNHLLLLASLALLLAREHKHWMGLWNKQFNAQISLCVDSSFCSYIGVKPGGRLVVLKHLVAWTDWLLHFVLCGRVCVGVSVWVSPPWYQVSRCCNRSDCVRWPLLAPADTRYGLQSDGRHTPSAWCRAAEHTSRVLAGKQTSHTRVNRNLDTSLMLLWRIYHLSMVGVKRGHFFLIKCVSSIYTSLFRKMCVYLKSGSEYSGTSYNYGPC